MHYLTFWLNILAVWFMFDTAASNEEKTHTGIMKMIDGWLVDGGFAPELDRKPRLDIDTGNFTAKVDNFDSNNLATYNQRYWYITKWAKPDGPQFLFIEGETTAKANWIADDDFQLVSLAKELGASFFLLEHRFYGESQPTGNLSIESLKYLTSQQALADIKKFILGMNAKFNRAWFWQTCNEFGFYQTANSPLVISEMTDENVIPIDYFIKKCVDVFGDVFDNSTIYKNVDETNAIYKGQKGYNGTRVVFSNGSNDPWHVLSVLEATNEQNYPILINGTSHCADLYPATENDNPNLKHARELIRKHVISWVKNVDEK
uniref:Uncharacterized protein n=1 Tax=Panagrolaimus sp. JU765 TaxID=591449 RepID=A0AC34QF93_9BILA